MIRQLVFVQLLHRFHRISSLQGCQRVNELRAHQIVVLHAHFESRQYTEVISRKIAQHAQVELHHAGSEFDVTSAGTELH